MKAILVLLCLALASCQTPAQNERLSRLLDLAVTAAEKRGAISAQDAADIRSAKSIALPQSVETTSGK